MPEVTPRSPEPSRSVSALARALVAAARTWSLYPADQRAVRTSVESSSNSAWSRFIRPRARVRRYPPTLLFGGVPAVPAGAVGEAAVCRHQHARLMRRQSWIARRKAHRNAGRGASDCAGRGRRTGAATFEELLRRLAAVGTLVRLSTDEVAVVTHEHPSDPFRPR
jgi:hypothetical protein